MKHFLTSLFFVILFLQVFPQNISGEAGKEPDKVFFGLSYNYLDIDLKLVTLTKHSVWGGADLGTVELEKKEIDELNSFMNYTEQVNNINLGAGMVLLNKPGGHWYVDGRIYVGFSYRNHILLNTNNDTADVEIKSVHYSPSFGLGFHFRYLLDEKWGLNLGVNSLFASGKVSKIDESIYPVVDFMNESRNNKFRMSYSSANLLASYTFQEFTFQAGPGFYFLYSKNEYHIVRSDIDDGSTYEDSFITTLRSDMFINAYLQIDWRLAAHFKIIAGAGIGKDLSANAALLYFL